MVGIESKLHWDEAPARSGGGLFGSGLWEAPVAVGYLVSFVMTAFITVVAVSIDHQVTIPNISLIFVLPVIVSGLGFGLGPSISSAVLGALAFNYFLTEPRYSLTVDDPANIWAIALLFLVGLIVSGIAYTSRRRATDAALLERQASVLQGYGRDVAAASNLDSIVSLTSQALAALFQAPGVVMLMTDGRVVSASKVGGAELTEPDFEAARSSWAAGAGARAGVYPDLASRFDFWPVRTPAGPSAVLGLLFDPDERPASPGRAVDVVASILSLALTRQQLQGASEPSPE